MQTQAFTPNPETRSSLLEKIKNTADQAAWTRFFDTYAAFIFTLARRSHLQHAEAEDVLQTVLSEIMQKLPAFAYDREKGGFRKWLATCTHLRIKDALRRQARRQAREVATLDQSEEQTEFLLRQADPGPDRFAEMAEEEWRALIRETALQQTRAQTSAKQFTLFHAVVIEEWPIENIITTYDVTRDQIYQARHRVSEIFTAAAEAAARHLDAPCPAP